jgi:hypothetical protein
MQTDRLNLHETEGEIPIAAATADAATKTASPDVAVALPPHPTDVDDADAHIDSVTDTRSARWTPAEDAELTNAVVGNTCKAKLGKKYIKDWAAVAALVPSRNITRAAGRVGKWTEGEDIKLKDAVRTHGGKNWGKIAALVLNRTETQCSTRFNPSIDRANVRTGIWTEDDAIKLKDAVQMYGGKNWGAIALLVSCRTRC